MRLSLFEECALVLEMLLWVCSPKFQPLARIADRSLASSVLGRAIIDVYAGSNTPQPHGAPWRAATERWQARRTSACRIHPHPFANGNIPFEATGHLAGL